MTLWANTDNAANSTISAAAQLQKAPTTAEQTALFGNTTPDAYYAGATIGQFGVDAVEMQAARVNQDDRPAHAGWVLRTVGSGGRAGRVFQETLVAMKTIGSDATDDTQYPDVGVVINTQPVGATGDLSLNEAVTFTVVGSTVPAGGPLTYLWQYTPNPAVPGTFATTVAVPGFSNQTTATLTANAGLIADGTLVRAVVSSTGAESETSVSAKLTVVP